MPIKKHTLNPFIRLDFNDADYYACLRESSLLSTVKDNDEVKEAIEKVGTKLGEIFIMNAVQVVLFQAAVDNRETLNAITVLNQRAHRPHPNYNQKLVAEYLKFEKPKHWAAQADWLSSLVRLIVCRPNGEKALMQDVNRLISIQEQKLLKALTDKHAVSTSHNPNKAQKNSL